MADSATKNNRIYNVAMDARWTYLQPDDKNEKLDFTTGKVQLTIKNNTNIPLTFTQVKVRHHCQQRPEGREMYPQYQDRDYSFGFSKAHIRNGQTETQQAEVFTKAHKGPCGSGYGGVARSEVLDVDFHQHKMIPFDQKMKCGDRRVPIVWTLSPSLKRYVIFTETGMIARNFETIKGRDGSTLSLMERHTQISLKKDICGGDEPDAASKNRWRVFMIKHIKKWVDACSRDDIREKCKNTYEKINKGWAEGSSGVRG